MSQPEPPPDEPAVAEELSEFIGTGIGGHIEVLRVAAEQKVSNSAANQKGLMASTLEAVKDLERVAGDVGPGEIVLRAGDYRGASVRLGLRVVQSGSVGEFNRFIKPGIISAPPGPGTSAPFV